MADIRLEREFPVSAERLFDAVTSPAMLVQWWGHEGWRFQDEALDFSRLGPWHAAMLSDEGNLYKHSGQVTRFDPPQRVAFTWGWHDAQNKRGPESHVTFTVEETSTGARLIIDHLELPSQDIAAQHARGWAGPLKRLEGLLTSQTVE